MGKLYLFLIYSGATEDKEELATHFIGNLLVF